MARDFPPAFAQLRTKMALRHADSFFVRQGKATANPDGFARIFPQYGGKNASGGVSDSGGAVQK